jgi:hypothetical protein
VKRACPLNTRKETVVLRHPVDHDSLHRGSALLLPLASLQLRTHCFSCSSPGSIALKMQRLSFLPSRRFLFIFVPLHAAASVALFISAFSMGMSRLDTGGPKSLLETALETSSKVLLSPVFMAVTASARLRPLFPGLLAYLPLLVNSLVWAVLVWLLAAAASRLKTFNR